MAQQVTVPTVRAAKGGTPLVMVTAYDAPTARIADDAGVDVILVGDSVAMVVLGYDDTLQVDGGRHGPPRRRGGPGPAPGAGRGRPAVAELPPVARGRRPQRRRAGPGRGGRRSSSRAGQARVPVVEALVDAQIPVMGHLGLTPQSVHALGRLPGAGPADRGGRRAGRRRPGPGRRPGASPSSWSASPGRWPAWSRPRWPCPPSASAPGPTATARCSSSTTCSAWRTGSRPSSSAATARSRPTRSPPCRPTPPTCGPRAFPSDAESYHLSDEVAAALGVDRSRSSRRTG